MVERLENRDPSPRGPRSQRSPALSLVAGWPILESLDIVCETSGNWLCPRRYVTPSNSVSGASALERLEEHDVSRRWSCR